MQITHEQARKLIQFNLDGVLESAEKAKLSAHLQDCRDCKAYANELREVESILLPVMIRQWNARLIPLSIPLLIQSKSPVANASKLLAMRSIALSLIFIAFFFSAWKIVSSGPLASSPIPLVVPVVPTPFTQTAEFINTKSTSENCEMMLYSVQANDTLASIASQFLITEDEIMEVNGLKTDAISSSMELMIPLCNFTPTSTIHPVTFTITNTPVLRATTSTPEG